MGKRIEVARVDEIAPGERIFVEVGSGLYLVIFNVEGQFYAIEDRCTHDDGPLGDGDLDGYAVECPRHGARFDIRDGKVLSMPAIRPVPSFPLTVEGDRIYAEITG